MRSKQQKIHQYKKLSAVSSLCHNKMLARALMALGGELIRARHRLGFNLKPSALIHAVCLTTDWLYTRLEGNTHGA